MYGVCVTCYSIDNIVTSYRVTQKRLHKVRCMYAMFFILDIIDGLAGDSRASFWLATIYSSIHFFVWLKWRFLCYFSDTKYEMYVCHLNDACVLSL